VQWVLAQGLGFIGLQHMQIQKSRCNGFCSGFRVYWITADAEVKVQWVLAQGLGFIGLQHIQMQKLRCNGFLLRV